jgi:hypothetical protein
LENQKEKEREEKFRKENYERKRSKFSEGKFEKEEENEESAPKVKIFIGPFQSWELKALKL